MACYIRADRAEKRVELHAHTKMSALDAVDDTKELVVPPPNGSIKQSQSPTTGWSGIPEAMNAAEELKVGMDIKILYGVEAYYINDDTNIVRGGSDQPGRRIYRV